MISREEEAGDPGEDKLETGNETETGIDKKEESDSEDDICFFSNLERNNDPAKLKVSLNTTGIVAHKKNYQIPPPPLAAEGSCSG